MINTIKKSIISGIIFFLTVILLSVTYAATIGTVQTSDPLTSTLWNNLVAQVNKNSTPPVFSGYLTADVSSTTEVLLSGWTETADNTNSFSNGIFTAPVPGYYKINYEGLYNHGTVNSYGRIYLYVNNVISARGTSIIASTGYSNFTGINRIYYLNAGETIKLTTIVSNSSAYVYGGSYSHFTIEYVGE